MEWIEADVPTSRTTPAASLGPPARGAAVAVETGRAVIEAARAGPGRGRPSTRSGASGCCARTAAGPTASAPGCARSSLAAATTSRGSPTGGDWYVGRPLIVTENDYGLRLFNGDTGVVVDSGGGRVVAAFERGGSVLR